MKIKNIYLFLLLFLTVFFRQSFANFTQTNDLDLGDLGISTTIPSQISNLTLRSYFRDACTYCANLDLKERKNDLTNKTKTSIFNQSITKYVKEIYNNDAYANFISQNGSHLIEFLEISDELNLDLQSLYTGIRLFHNKIKSCELIDDSVIIQILEPLPTLLEKHFIDQDYESQKMATISQEIEAEIFSKLTQHLANIPSEQNIFIKTLSEQLSQIIKNDIEKVQKNIDDKDLLERLRQTIIKLLETSIGKTIWNNKNPKNIWNSVLSISNNLQLLGVHGIINHWDDLDDLHWSLIHRFCYYLDLEGITLPQSFYEEIETDLYNKTVSFLEAPEQDEGIKTKKEILSKALLKSKTRAFAFEKQGLITN